MHTQTYDEIHEHKNPRVHMQTHTHWSPVSHEKEKKILILIFMRRATGLLG